MGIFKDCKSLLRSRSWQFVANRKKAPQYNKLVTYRWNSHLIYYRPGTSDQGVIWDILIRKGRAAEYWVPKDLQPKVILDIGSNIGVSALLLAKQFPDATVYAFEPIKENFEILQRNVASYKNIQAFNIGLGDKEGEFAMYANLDNKNLGGFSLYALETDNRDNLGVETKPVQMVQVKEAATFFKEHGITRADIIKIDTEGAEHAILTAMPTEIIANASWLMGEVHGVKNFELMTYLDKWHSITLNLPLKSRQGIFFALNKNLLESTNVRRPYW